MEFPANAVYGPDHKKTETPRAVDVAGVRVPGQHVWLIGVGLIGMLVVATIVVLFVLPSGIPFLAAKFAGGFLEYVGLFFVYMIGFFFLLILFGMLAALVGVRAIPFLTRNNG